MICIRFCGGHHHWMTSASTWVHLILSLFNNSCCDIRALSLALLPKKFASCSCSVSQSVKHASTWTKARREKLTSDLKIIEHVLINFKFEFSNFDLLRFFQSGETTTSSYDAFKVFINLNVSNRDFHYFLLGYSPFSLLSVHCLHMDM